MCTYLVAALPLEVDATTAAHVVAVSPPARHLADGVLTTQLLVAVGLQPVDARLDARAVRLVSGQQHCRERAGL